MRSRVVGQHEAVEAVADAVLRAHVPDCKIRTGRSARSFFSGPTGVGKTELAKALAEFLFDDESAHDAHRHVGISWKSMRSPG